MKRHITLWILALAAALFLNAANAHSIGTSYVRIDEASPNGALDAHVSISLRDLAFAIGLDLDGNGSITWGEVNASEKILGNYVRDRLTITRGTSTCRATEAQEPLSIDNYADGPYALIAFRLNCDAQGAIGVVANLLFDIDTSHRTLLSIGKGNVTVLTAQQNKSEQTTEGSLAAFGRFIVQGVWHIWTGFDHLAFLILLLLPVLRTPSSIIAIVPPILRVVTAFTLAHSITLGMAALGYLHFSSQWVEALIAASIVFTAIINLTQRSGRFGVAIAFGFGLIHGLGFASALAEITEQTANRLPPLLGFNIGVELGQLAIVLLVTPLMLTQRLMPILRARVTQICSIAIGCVGTFWLLQRIGWT